MSADGWLLAATVALGVVAVGAGVLVFVVDSMARATFALLGSFLAVAVLLALLDLAYLAAVVALMMTVEMAVMAVFMVAFMMNPAGLVPMTMVHAGRPSAAVAVGVFVLLTTGVWMVDLEPAGAGATAGEAMDGAGAMGARDATVQLGEAIMGPYMLTTVVIGVALLATILSATVLATSRGRYDRFGDDLRSRPPRDPARGGLPW